MDYNVLENEVATLDNEESATGGGGGNVINFQSIFGKWNYFFEIKASDFIDKKILLVT